MSRQKREEEKHARGNRDRRIERFEGEIGRCFDRADRVRREWGCGGLGGVYLDDRMGWDEKNDMSLCGFARIDCTEDSGFRRPDAGT